MKSSDFQQYALNANHQKYIHIPSCLLTHEHNLPPNVLRLLLYTFSVNGLKENQEFVASPIVLAPQFIANVIATREKQANIIIREWQDNKHTCQIDEKSTNLLFSHVKGNPIRIFGNLQNKEKTMFLSDEFCQLIKQDKWFFVPLSIVAINSEWYMRAVMMAYFHLKDGNYVESDWYEAWQIVRLLCGRNLIKNEFKYIRFQVLPKVNEKLGYNLTLEQKINTNINKELYRLIGTVSYAH